MPLPRRKKLITLGIVAIGVLVLCVALLSVEDRLRETWYLWRLDSTEDTTARAQIIERLGRVGRDQAFRALCLNIARECPFVMFTRREPLLPLILDRVSGACLEYSPAVTKIRERIGQRKSLAILIEIVHDKTAHLHARVYCAQWVSIGLCKTHALPEALKAANRFAPGTPEWAILLEGREDAIEVLVKGLDSEDGYLRAGASFALSLCGPEAISAVPALRNALQDKDERVSKDAADALRRIEGQEK